MESKEIRRYAKLMEELDIAALEITENGTTLKLERAKPAPAAGRSYAPAPAETAERDVREDGVILDDAGVVTIASPMVGTFYCAPAEGAQPYVAVGTKVKKGDVLCIIEAMKLMNEITAECSGVIEQICIEDKAFVDYGTPLFKVRRELRA